MAKKISFLVRKFFLFVFVILLSISFVVYLGGDTEPLAPEAQEIGRIGDYVVKNTRDSDFSRNYQLISARYRELYGGVDPEAINQYAIREAFMATIIDHLLEKENEKNKIVVSDEQVIASLIDLYFAGDEADYREYVKTADKADLKRLEKTARKDALRKIYINTFAKGIPVPDSEVEENLDISKIQRKAIIGVMVKDVLLNEAIDDDALLGYFRQNISRYLDNVATSPSDSGLQNNQQGNGSALDLNRALNLTNQNSGIAPSNDASLSEEVILEQFSTNKARVREDYLLENGENWLASFKEDLTFKINDLNLKEGQTSEQDFLNLVENANFRFFRSEFFSYFSREIKDEGSGLAFIREPNVIRRIFLVPLGSVSEIFEQEELFYVVLNYLEDEEEASSFVKRQYENQLKSQAEERITQNYFNYLVRKSQDEIFLLGQKLEL